MCQHNSTATEQFNKLIDFRQAAYAILGAARDALFELGDAVLVTPHVHSLAELSLTPVFRRRWPSVYAALADSHPPRSALLSLYTAHMPSTARPVLAGDHTAWPRLKAWTLRERTVEHQPTAVPGNRPITLGHGYSTLVWVPETAGSWALPLLHERIASDDTPIARASAQLRQASACLSQRPVALYDSEYGCAPFVEATADIAADTCLRLRPNLCLFGPPVYKGRGRRPKHGAKFKLSDPTTWPTPVASQETHDPQLGRLRVRVWRNLHVRQAAQHPLWVFYVERLDARGTRRDPTGLWLAWHGQDPPALLDTWRLYLRRFAVDHWYRFAKQRLHWTVPLLSTPERSQSWSDLMPLLSWQLWLARPSVADQPLPWQKPQPTPTPGRVAQGMANVLAVIGTPTQAPKGRGKSSGWPTGQERKRRERPPVVKKARLRAKKSPPKAKQAA